MRVRGVDGRAGSFGMMRRARLDRPHMLQKETKMAAYKILIPLDGSRLAEHSLSYLRAFKDYGEPRVELMSVADVDEDYRGLKEEDAKDREINVLRGYLREVSEKAKSAFGVEAGTRVVGGSPAEAILKEAEAFNPDLIVISTHGRSGLSRWRFGSVADKVIRGGNHNTLVIGPKAADKDSWLDDPTPPSFKSILVPLDGSELGEAALGVAQALTTHFDSAVHLVRATPIPTVDEGMGGAGMASAELMESLVEGARQYLATVAARVTAAGGVKTEVLIGPAAAGLEDYIEEHDIDVVVMTSHGRSGVARVALGSVTDRLLGAGKAPVLVVRSVAQAS